MSLYAMVWVPPFGKGGQGGFLRSARNQMPPNPPHSPFCKGGSRDVERANAMSMPQ